MESNDFMGGQPTPPNIPPSDIRLIIRPYYGKPMPNNPWIRPYFWGGYMGGGWLTSHNDCPFRFGVIFWFQPCNRYSLVGKNPNWLSRKKPLWHCLIGILISWITRIPTLLGRISSPIYPKQPVFFWLNWSHTKSSPPMNPRNLSTTGDHTIIQLAQELEVRTFQMQSLRLGVSSLVLGKNKITNPTTVWQFESIFS